ncbi:MAG: type II secretion system protein [Micavibrio sp.]
MFNKNKSVQGSVHHRPPLIPSGFTLIELAIVTVIIGLLLASFLGAARIYLEKQQAEKMELRLKEIRGAFADYILDEAGVKDAVRYPCPAPLNAAPNSPAFGKELCPENFDSLSAGQDLGGVYVVEGTGGNLVLVGTIPTSTLQIGSGRMMDVYNNRLTYAVTANLVKPGALAATVIPEGGIRILNQGNGNVTNKAVFAIVSHGRDGAGSWTAQGAPNGKACRKTATAGAGDSRNCLWSSTNKAIFREQIGFSLADRDSFYDDRLVFSLQKDDGWWRATNESGDHITNNNPGNVGIGVLSGDPGAKLDVVGNIRASTAITANKQVNSDLYCNAAGKSCIPQTDLVGIIKCNSFGKLYRPEHKDAGASGCVSILAVSDIVVTHNSICTRGGVHSFYANCPKGYQLLGCTGGSGDLLEGGEGFFIVPEYENSRCKMVIGQPACVESAPWTHTHVYASCMKIE